MDESLYAVAITFNMCPLHIKYEPEPSQIELMTKRSFINSFTAQKWRSVNSELGIPNSQNHIYIETWMCRPFFLFA